MYKIFIFIFITFLTISFSKEIKDIDNVLKSKNKSIVYVQELYVAGEYDKAIEISKKALILYPKNLALLKLKAKSNYELHNLENARIDFVKVLDMNPTDDNAQEAISKIDIQESAKTNKSLDTITGFLADKGFSLLMIFLGFLGAEIISKKYSKCKSHLVKNEIFYFIKLQEKSSFLTKLNMVFFKNINSLLSTCKVLSIIIFMTIIATISIILTYIFIFIADKELLLMTNDEISIRILFIILVSLILFFIYKTFKIYTINIKEIDITNILQNQALSNEFDSLFSSIEILIDNNINMGKILEYCTSNDAKEIIHNTITLVKKEKQFI